MFSPPFPALRLAQQRAMLDRCTITPRTASTNTVSDETLTPGTPITNVACGVSFEAGSRVEGENYITIFWDATLRLPWDTAVGLRDLITITNFRGQAWSENFELVKPPERGGTAQNILLRRVPQQP